MITSDLDHKDHQFASRIIVPLSGTRIVNKINWIYLVLVNPRLENCSSGSYEVGIYNKELSKNIRRKKVIQANVGPQRITDPDHNKA